MSFGQYSERGGREWREAAEAINARRDGDSGRIRRTFDSPERVAHLWAHQSQDSAKYRDNFYFTGRSLFSYGSHYLVGFVMPDGAESRDVTLLNADSNSNTTNGHRRLAERAAAGAQFSLPGLTDLRDVLETLAAVSLRNVNARLSGSRDFRKLAETDISGMPWPDSRPHIEAANVRQTVRRWLESEARAIGTAGARYVGATWLAMLAGYSEAQAARIIRDAIKADDAAKERRAKAERERDLRDAKRIATRSADTFRDEWPRDGDDAREDSWNAKEHKQYATRLFRLAKLAREAGWTRIAATLKAREKEFRAHSAGRADRIRARYRSGLAAEVRAWRAGDKRPDAWRFSGFPAIKAALERAEAREWAERHAREFAEWQAGAGKRPSVTAHEKDSPEYAAIVASIAADRAAFLAGVALWQGGFAPRPAVLASDAIPPYGHAESAAINTGIQAIRADVEREQREAREAAERERQRERFEREAEARRAWLAGDGRASYSLSDDTGGALLRAVNVERDAAGNVTGGTLETSHGADVPLTHAIKAFRFVKLVRERGDTWRRNGRVIRVGHYQIDCIDSGGFNAGCHRINWPEIERLALALGVYDAPASDSAVESSH